MARSAPEVAPVITVTVTYLDARLEAYREEWGFPGTPIAARLTGLLLSQRNHEFGFAPRFAREPRFVTAVELAYAPAGLSLADQSKAEAFAEELLLGWPSYSPWSVVEALLTDAAGTKCTALWPTHPVGGAEQRFVFAIPALGSAQLVDAQVDLGGYRETVQPSALFGNSPYFLDGATAQAWRAAWRERQAELKAAGRAALEIQDPAAELELTPLHVARHELLAVDYTLCTISSRALRTYFAQKYPANLTAFNQERQQELARADRLTGRTELVDAYRRLVVKTACETGFVILAGSAFTAGRLADPQLLDGFMRTFWPREDDELLLVKVFTGLTPYQRQKLMFMANLWKIRQGRAEFVLDRGFALYLWEETGLLPEPAVEPLVALYGQFGQAKHDEWVYLDLWLNRQFVADYVALRELHAFRDLQGRPLPAGLLQLLATELGRFRHRHLDEPSRPLPGAEFAAFLCDRQPYLDKLHAMSVPARIEQNLRAQLLPQVEAFFTTHLLEAPAA